MNTIIYKYLPWKSLLSNKSASFITRGYHSKSKVNAGNNLICCFIVKDFTNKELTDIHLIFYMMKYRGIQMTEYNTVIVPYICISELIFIRQQLFLQMFLFSIYYLTQQWWMVVLIHPIYIYIRWTKKSSNLKNMKSRSFYLYIFFLYMNINFTYFKAFDLNHSYFEI